MFGCFFFSWAVLPGCLVGVHRVAIKIIHDVFRTSTDARRTLRELSILRQLDHPNICGLYDVLSPVRVVDLYDI